MKKTSLALSGVYRLLEPGPVVMVTSARGGRANVMTMSWHMMIDFEPPIIACVISNRDYTFGIVKQTKECVINIPTVNLARKVVGCGNTSGRDVGQIQEIPSHGGARDERWRATDLGMLRQFGMQGSRCESGA